LQAGHAGLTCQSCHSGSGYTGLRGNDCASCHVNDDVHEGRNGNDCGSCHGVTQWASVTFDHAAVSGFTLVGTHAGLACTDCHAESLTVALPDSCSACHTGDDAHLGQLGNQCLDCHGQDTWNTQVLFDHDLTAFPLVGLHADVECKECHATAAFHDAPSDCVDCHRADDPHGRRLGTACASCHNPGAWLAWDFDHQARTGFALTDGHADVACTDCHRQPVNGGVTTSNVCGTCHRRDDPHENHFGAECGRCHTTRSFSELENL
ncbi:MAG: cytochrome c3 family protein, partial [Gammaproteobacteria bacterium]